MPLSVKAPLESSSVNTISSTMDLTFPLDDLSVGGHRDTFAKSNENTPLQADRVEDNGFRVITGCFAVLTVIISIALSIHLYHGGKQVVLHGSVVSDNVECSIIGERILGDGGNAVDAAVAVTLCTAVVLPHLTSLGGGGLMLIYNHREGQSTCFDFQVKALAGKEIGVPGLVKGLFSAHSAQGLLKWKQIVQPVADLARKGFTVSESLASSLTYSKENSAGSLLSKWLDSLKVGSTITPTRLAQTFDLIAEEGADVFYKGKLSKELLQYFTQEELSSYTVSSEKCLEGSWAGYQLYTTGARTGGTELLKSIKYLSLSNDSTSLSTLLSLKSIPSTDSRFDSGVVVSVMDNDENYVSTVSGLGSVMGSQVLTEDGFFLNKAFNIPPTAQDEYSSLSLPLVATESDTCGKRFVLGATDYRDAIQLLVPLLSSETDLLSSVESPRVRLDDSTVYIEELHAPSLSHDEMVELNKAGFKLTMAHLPYPSLNVIRKVGDVMEPYADSRGQGKAILF